MEPTRPRIISRGLVREQDFKAPQGQKVSLRRPLVATRINIANRTLNGASQLRQGSCNPCRNCSVLFERVRHLERENAHLREHQQKSKEDSEKLERLCVQIARTKEKMVAKLVQKQKDLMDVLSTSTSRGLLSSRNDSFNQTTVLPLLRQMPTRVTGPHHLKVESLGI